MKKQTTKNKSTYKGKSVSFVVMMMLLSFGVKVEAVVVSTTFDTLIHETKPSATKLLAFSWSGYISTTIEKTINFKLLNNTIVGSQSILDVGQSIILSENKTYGSWFLKGKFHDSPPSDNKFYYLDKYTMLAESKPADQSLPVLSSSNISVLECINNQSCIARNPGSAVMTVSFPQKSNPTSVRSLSPEGDFGFGLIHLHTYAKYGPEDSVSRPYSFPSITYTVTVPGTPNTPQVSTCTGTTNITKDSATVNWSYTDVDNDPQTQYQVQLSTKSYSDPSFSTSTDVVFSSSSASSVTNHTFTGLTPSTTYYSRIRTYNATNGWSVYTTCNTGFTTLTDDLSQPTCSCNGTRDYTCKKTDGTVVSTEVNSSQCTFGSACTVENTPTDTTFTIIPLNGLGSITYSHGTISKTLTNIERYYYPTPTLNTVQSLTVNLLDNLDGKTSTAKCSIDNTKIVCNGDHNEGDTTCPSGTEVKWNCDTSTGTWKSTDTSKTCTSTPTTPTIKITKKPAITLNKGGRCTLDWNITNRPTDMVCTLTGTGGTVSEILADKPSGTWSSPALFQNTKYTIKCTSSTPATTISASTICRINPSIGEI